MPPPVRVNMYGAFNKLIMAGKEKEDGEIEESHWSVVVVLEGRFDSSETTKSRESSLGIKKEPFHTMESSKKDSRNL